MGNSLPTEESAPRVPEQSGTQMVPEQSGGTTDVPTMQELGPGILPEAGGVALGTRTCGARALGERGGFCLGHFAKLCRSRGRTGSCS